MFRLFLPCLLLLSSCATFDKTNILPGQRVQGFGFSFAVPGDQAWFAVVMGNSNRLKLSQLNYEDSFSIQAILNRGPDAGMFDSAESHLAAMKNYLANQQTPRGYIPYSREEWVNTEYGETCVSYLASGEDWRGRNRPGPALVDVIGLSCAHPKLQNTLLRLEISRRFETDARRVNLNDYARSLFNSLEYHAIN